MPSCKGSRKRPNEAHLLETEGGQTFGSAQAGTDSPRSTTFGFLLRASIWLGLTFGTAYAQVPTASEPTPDEGAAEPSDPASTLSDKDGASEQPLPAQPLRDDSLVHSVPDATTPTARLDEAWRRIDLRDFEGARLITRTLTSGHEDLAREAMYATAVSYELERQHAQAIDVFEEIIEVWPDHHRATDARFRVALTWADAHEPKQALRALKRVRQHTALDDEAQWKVRLSEGTWQLEAGRVRRGVRLLAPALEELPEGTLTWFEARARYALLHHACEASKVLDFDIPEPRVAKTLDARAAYVLSAKAQLGAIADLPEPYFVLHALMELGDAYLDLGEDLLASREPKRLSDSQVALYRQGVYEKANMQFVKARRLFDLGREHAGRVGWRGPEIAKLDEKLAQVDARLESE